MFRPVLVTAPAAALYTDAEVKSHLSVDSSDWDAMITLLIAVATARLDGWSGVLGRCLINQTWRQDFGTFAECLRLPFPDVSAVTLKYYDTSNVQQTVTAADYELLEDELGSYVKPISSFSPPSTYDERQAPVSATMTVGFGASAAAVPANIRSAGLLLIGHLFANREAVNIGNIPTIVPMGFDALIEPYRRVGI